jgi:non-specific serine/threonine protein kinase/serine/threonine-protein kinase
MSEENSAPQSGPKNPDETANHGNADDLTANPTVSAENTLDSGENDPASAKTAGRISIGPYSLVKKLGEGGMGQVWLAEQTAPVKRLVALKLIKGGLYDSRVIQRFDSERQSLARMNHPSIAKIFDAGSTPDGQPYFVMEYVNGPSITRYCDNKKLKIRERLELFIKVCEAVQHAHQKAIIHRDLKPSNVLVEEVDGKPVPRIIDFGIAKAISSEADADQTSLTKLGALVGTPGFMSPEQADPAVLDVDTRTDVYSLGVILYVLLTGRLPFDPDEWTKRPIDEVLRQLRQEDPPSPSAKLSGEKKAATESAGMRSSDQTQLVKILRGDLDWITLRALEKDRSRRYSTPSALAADIQRYLENLPVLARPASTGYRLRKYVRRHRLGVSVAALIALLLIAFVATLGVQLRRITQERDRTARERDRANRITSYMIGMFRQSDPSKAKGSTTAREMLDQASQDIDKSLAQDPELQTHLMGVMGEIYYNLELFKQADALIQRAYEIRKSAAGMNDRQTFTTMLDLVVVLQAEGRYAEAEKLAHQTLDAERKALGDLDPDTLRIQNKLATVLINEARYSEAEKLQRDTLEKQRRVLGLENKDTLSTMNGLAISLDRENQFPECMKLFHQLLEIEPRVFGPDNPDTLLTEKHAADALMDSGHYADAEKLQRHIVETNLRRFGPDNSLTISAEADLAHNMLLTAKFPEAEKILRKVLESRVRVQGPESHPTLSTMVDLAYAISVQGRPQEAEKIQRQGLEISTRALGPSDRLTLIFAGQLAATLGDLGRLPEAEKLLQNARAIQLDTRGLNHVDTAETTYSLACIEARMGHRTQALTLLGEAIDHGLPPRYDNSLETDGDLSSLHGDPRFAALIAHAKERDAAQKPD